jgi:hypothetical protein
MYSIESRVKHCDCELCSHPEIFLTCVERQFYEMEYKPSEIRMIIKKIKRKIKLRQLFLIYAKCLSVFNKLYNEIVEKRYRPYGNGYEEAKIHFHKYLKQLKNINYIHNNGSCKFIQ